MTEQTADSLLMGGASFWSWAVKNELGQYKTKPYGAKISGTVAAIGEPQQQTDWDTGALLTWPDGKPKMQFAITLDVDWAGTTGEVQTDATDTQRSVMIKQSSAIQAALRDAIKNASASGLQLGAYVTFTLTGEQPSNKGNPVKTFAAEYRLPAQGVVMDGGQPHRQGDWVETQQGYIHQPQAQPQPSPVQPQQQPVQGYAPGQQVPPNPTAAGGAVAPQQAPPVPATPPAPPAATSNQQDPFAIAKQLKHEMKLPPEQVAAATGLTVEQVNQIPPF